MTKTVCPSKTIEGVKQSTSIYHMFEGYYIKTLSGGKGASPPGFTGTPKYPKSSNLGVPVNPGGEGPRPQIFFGNSLSSQ